MMNRFLNLATPNTNSIGNTHKQFKCDGCVVMETGVGYKHECRKCDFDLHEKCALAPPPCKILFNYGPKLMKVYVFSKLEKC